MAKKKKDVVAAETPATVATEAKAEQEPTLLWNERGQIGCTLPGHAPHKGSDTWLSGRWRRIRADELLQFESKVECEACAQADRAPAQPAAGEPPAEAATSATATSETGAGGEAGADPQATDPAPVHQKQKGKKTKADLTLADLAERYVAHLDEAGKSAGTSASYGLEMKTALAELGADTKLADLTPEQVLAYFASKRVTRKKNGKHKSPLSIAKTCRVLRLALVWAVEKKLIEKAPLPEALATH